jgi:hypothetical protein
MAQPREVGFPDGQFLANGVDESSSLQLADCWKQGDHAKAQEIISNLPQEVQPVAERIYGYCKQVAPREGMYD